MAGVCECEDEEAKDIAVLFHLVGTGTSVRPPSVVAWARRTKATKGLLRKSTSPTKTLEASASLGIFFMNLFFSYRKRRDKNRTELVSFLLDISDILLCYVHVLVSFFL